MFSVYAIYLYLIHVFDMDQVQLNKKFPVASQCWSHSKLTFLNFCIGSGIFMLLIYICSAYYQTFHLKHINFCSVLNKN
jgi:hypothetical protein